MYHQTFREIEKEKADYHWTAKKDLGLDAELGLLRELRPEVRECMREVKTFTNSRVWTYLLMYTPIPMSFAEIEKIGKLFL